MRYIVQDAESVATPSSRFDNQSRACRTAAKLSKEHRGCFVVRDSQNNFALVATFQRGKKAPAPEDPFTQTCEECGGVLILDVDALDLRPGESKALTDDMLVHRDTGLYDCE